MEHKVEFKTVELMPGQFMQVHSVMPSILKRKDNVFNVVTDGKLQKGDVVWEVFTNNQWEVLGIIEQRKAKGDWSGESYIDTKPTWQKVSVTKKQ